MKMLSRLFAFGCISFYLLAPSAIIFAASPPPACQLSLNTTVIPVGGSVTLSWSSTNATEGAITNVGNVGPSGSINLLPSSAAYTTYIGSFTGPGGTGNCSATVQVSLSSGGTQNVTLQNATVGNTAATNPNAIESSALPPPAQPTSGLVPCGYNAFSTANTTDSATGCQACNLAGLVENIITFVIGLSFFIAAALFAWAGALYFTSGATPANKEKAKGIFKNAFLGFLIAITGWLVVNTLLHVLFANSTTIQQGSWFTISCSTTVRPVNANISDVLSQVLGGGQVTNNVSSSGGSAYVCQTGTLQNGNCVDSNNNVIGTPTLVTTPANSGLSCSPGTYLAGGNCYDQGGVLQGPATPTLSGAAAYACPTGYQLATNGSDSTSGPTCYNPTTNDVQDAACQSGYSTNANGFCQNDATGQVADLNAAPSATALGVNGNLISAVYQQETASGAKGANVCNSYDACGPMQIQPGTACNTDSTIQGCNANGTVANQAQVENYLNTAGLSANQTLAGQILTNNLNSSYCNGGTMCALAEYNGGVKAVVTSADCSSGYAYQCPYDSTSQNASTLGQYCNGTTITGCTANTGFQQTRNYVQSVCSKTSC